MEKTTNINSLDDEFDYSAVPGWYTLCFNADCPLHGNCMRFLTGSHEGILLRQSPHRQVKDAIFSRFLTEKTVFSYWENNVFSLGKCCFPKGITLKKSI